MGVSVSRAMASNSSCSSRENVLTRTRHVRASNECKKRAEAREACLVTRPAPASSTWRPMTRMYGFFVLETPRSFFCNHRQSVSDRLKLATWERTAYPLCLLGEDCVDTNDGAARPRCNLVRQVAATRVSNNISHPQRANTNRSTVRSMWRGVSPVGTSSGFSCSFKTCWSMHVHLSATMRKGSSGHFWSGAPSGGWLWCGRSTRQKRQRQNQKKRTSHNGEGVEHRKSRP